MAAAAMRSQAQLYCSWRLLPCSGESLVVAQLLALLEPHILDAGL